MRWLRDSNQRNIYNLKNARREVSRHFREKEIIKKGKIDELEINGKDINIRLFISVINQLDAQNFCSTINLFFASTCFEHMCPSSGGQNCITQPLVSSQL